MNIIFFFSVRPLYISRHFIDALLLTYIMYKRLTYCMRIAIATNYNRSPKLDRFAVQIKDPSAVGHEHQPEKVCKVKTCSQFLAPKTQFRSRPAASMTDLISKRPAYYVLLFVHRTECCSIFSKASIENPTAPSNINADIHNQGSCWLCETPKGSNMFGIRFFFGK